MKKMILAALVAFGASAFAGGYNINAQWCDDEFMFDDETTCLLTINEGYFHPGVGKVCGEVGFDDDKLNCVAFSKDKTYTSIELQACENESFSDDIAECMRDNGTPVGSHRGLTAEQRLNEISMLAEQVKRDLDRGNILMALANIAIILELATL